MPRQPDGESIACLCMMKLIRRLRKFGFKGPMAGGKHLYMTRGRHRLTIRNRHRREIGAALLERILKQAGIEPRDWTDA